MGLLSTPPPKPPLVPVGAYLTDGIQLVEVIESDHAGALAEDVKTSILLSLEKDELIGHEGREPRWRQVTPAQEAA